MNKYTKYTYYYSEAIGMFSTAQAAKHIGVSKNTLLRWLDEGLTEDVQRDWRGWRLWRQEDIERVKTFRAVYHSKPIRRARHRSFNRVEYARSAAASMARFGRGYSRVPEVGR
jgi:predicted site-specific integrase-resolvase